MKRTYGKRHHSIQNFEDEPTERFHDVEIVTNEIENEVAIIHDDTEKYHILEANQRVEETEELPEHHTKHKRLKLENNPNVGEDEDRYFALSLVGIFKRLTPQKRAMAKCHILQYLTELEYGNTL